MSKQATQSDHNEASGPEEIKSIPEVSLLMLEYFRLKDEDRAIRVERNTYMATHECQSPVRKQEGDCIHQERGMGGYPPELCEVCDKRNAWYLERQQLGRRRAVIIRRVKRLVQGTNMIKNSPETNIKAVRVAKSAQGKE